MKIETKTVIEIESEDLANIKSSLKKIVKDLESPGFKAHGLEQKEIDVIINLQKELDK